MFALVRHQYCWTGFHVEREALKANMTAPLLLWAALEGPHCCPAPLQLLEELQVVATFTDTDGVCSTRQLGQQELSGLHAVSF